ncbi:UNVERIFIED_CONTAM: hypothetical protein FKN15_040728 [Acipenser sinensis]
MGAVTFIKQDIRKNDAGDYTCMYGKENPGDVKNISQGSSVYLNVQGMLTLQLSKEIAMEGMDISFKCMIPDELRDATGKEDFFHLYKNGSLVDSQPDPKGLPAVEFSITNVKRSDTGNYTCVYGKDKFVNSANRKRSRPVYLHVTDIITESLRTAMIQIEKPTAVEGETIAFTCVISTVHGGQPENKEMNWFHLYKNREKIRSLQEPRGMGAVTFIKQDIRKNDAGKYTCMYGKENPGDVKNISHGSSVYLSVQESGYQLTLQLDKHNPMEGMDVSFKCMIPAELREAAGKEGLFHLYKNGSRVNSQAHPKGLPGVTFTIKNVTRKDTGNYTCVYGKEKLVNTANSKRSRPVYLHVTGIVPWSPRVVPGCEKLLVYTWDSTGIFSCVG